MGAFSSKPSTAANKPKKVEVTAIDRTVLDLKNSRDRLQRYRRKLEQDNAKLLARAAMAKNNGNKETTLGLLRLRKFKQQQAENCENQLLNVLQMVETIDSKQNEAAILQAMAAGKDLLKRMHEETTVDDVLELMDQIQEEREMEKEISDLLQNVPELSAADEQAVEDELAALLDETTATTTVPPAETAEQLPEAPTNKLPEIKTPATEATTTAAPEKKPERVAVPG
jgi:charged multivesicular body protein 6